MQTLYVSGPMTGYVEYNFPAFHKATTRLRSAGYSIICPAENWQGDEATDRALAMRLDIHQVLVADGLAVLPGWRQSKGALCEVEVARQIGLSVQTVGQWIKEAK